MMTRPILPRLLTLTTELGIDARDLDDAVYAEHTQAAGRVNAGGLPAQLTYLVAQLGETATEDLIRARSPLSQETTR